MLDAAALARRFPAFRLPPGTRALLEPGGGAGLLAPEACVRAHVECAERRGARVLCSARVERWQAARGGDGGDGLLRVHTSAGVFQGRRLVLTGGAWMPRLVPQLARLLTVERQVVGWFGLAAAAADAHAPGSLPVWLLDDVESGYFYGEARWDTCPGQQADADGCAGPADVPHPTPPHPRARLPRRRRRAEAGQVPPPGRQHHR